MAEARREWVWGALGIAAIAIVVLVLAPPASQVAMDYRPSTYRTTPDGTGALYEAVASLGIPADRRLTPLAGADRIRGPLVILEPVEPLSPTELDSLFAWVEGGGRLIVSPPGDEAFEEHLGLVLTYREDTAPVVRGSHPWTAGIDSVGEASWTFNPKAREAPRLRPLVVDTATGEPVAGLLSRGGGEILAIADGQLLTNERVLDGGLAPLVVRAADAWTRGSDTLWFDEYHHGHRGGSPYGALVRVLGRDGAGAVVVQFLLVALLALLPLAVRFGAPRDPAPEPRRSRLEHVDALGEVYRQAGADVLVRRRLIAGFA
ncbi:MAG: DUF4350 domain-containing protein, partial [Gemmatimonadota bacterium]